MRGEVGVTLLVTLVLLDVMKVVAADDNGAVHLGRLDDAREDTAADGHVTGEGAFLVDVRALDGLLGGLEAQADVLVPAETVLAGNLHHHKTGKKPHFLSKKE